MSIEFTHTLESDESDAVVEIRVLGHVHRGHDEAGSFPEYEIEEVEVLSDSTGILDAGNPLPPVMFDQYETELYDALEDEARREARSLR